MFNSPVTTPSKYHLRRVLSIALVLALLIAVKPALALFSSPEEEQKIVVTADAAYPPDSMPATATAVAAFDDILPVDRHLPELNVTAALVQELGAPAPLFAYRTAARWPLASVTKLMTAVVALDTLGPAAIISASEEAVATEGEAGNLKAGSKYSVIDLVRAMLTVSSNDAAIALAQAYDKKQLGDEGYAQALSKTALFTQMMQEKARAIGMSETYYGDPSGLSVVNQSVLTDLYTLMDYISLNYPEILDITRSKTAVIARRNSAGTVVDRATLVNINDFAGQSDFVGGKTGFIDQSQGNLLSIFKYEGKRYLIIVLGTPDRFGQTRALYDWIKTYATQ